MRILHSSDWHLGKLFEGHHLTDDQAYVLEDFVALVRDAKPDVVLIAGDLYDRAVPPQEAVVLFNDVLKRIVQDLRVPTVAIAGNHDGAERIDFASELLRHSGLTLVGDPLCKSRLTLTDKHGPVDFIPVPFATPEALRSALRERGQDDQVQGFEEAMRRQVQEAAAASTCARRVAIAHAFVTGGHSSESERELEVGGTGDVPAEIFEGFSYTALGHLHRPQWVNERDCGQTIRYSGSLLPYSFGEIDHPKSVTLLELGPSGIDHIEFPTLRAKRGLRKLKGTFDEIRLAAADDENREDYIWAEITDVGLVMQAMPRLREVYPNALKLTRAITSSPSQAVNRKDIRHNAPRDIVQAFWRDIGEEHPLSEEQSLCVDAAIGRALGEPVS